MMTRLPYLLNLVFKQSVFASILVTYALQAAQPTANPPTHERTFLNRYCVSCHNNETKEGKVDLASLPPKIKTIEQAELWQKVLNALNAGEMPPKDADQPQSKEKADFLEVLAQTMVTARKSLSDSGGTITMRRLNRREYANSIKHLIGVDVDVLTLPSDSGEGFDTIGASLFLSSDQFEKYLQLGRNAIDEMFARQAAIAEGSRVFRMEVEQDINPRNLREIEKIDEAQIRYQQWKTEVDRIKDSPENKAIIAEIAKTDKRVLHPHLFYQSADRLTGSPNAKDFGFRDSNDATFHNTGSFIRKQSYFKHYMNLPHNDTGAYLKLVWGIGRFDLTPDPSEVPPGRYKLRIRAGAVEGSPQYRRFIEVGHPQRRNGAPLGHASLPLSSHHVTGTIEAPTIIETAVQVTMASPKEFGIQERQPQVTTSLRRLYQSTLTQNGYGFDPAIWIDWMELEGPLPSTGTEAVLQQLLSSNKQTANDRDTDWARSILEQFSVHALRGVKPDPRFLSQLVHLYEGRRAAGETIDVALRTPLSVILASPGFLYLYEPGNDSQSRFLNDRELAVRLAYFLWSTPPDKELLDLAQQGTLHKPEHLSSQVNRMLDDRRTNRFVAGFVHQWLDMERLDFFQFDPSLHREFDENTRAAARQEVYHSFAHLLQNPNNGHLNRLLKADYIFINGLLAVFYGIEGVKGDEFQKVQLDSGSPRGGLLGMAAIHAMGSDGVNSSPVERGAWVLRHLLHSAPPPAPANVPQLSRLEDQALTTRQRLAAHQSQPQCATCHRKIDPVGFGMENFDAAGKWRVIATSGKGSNKKKWTIDASGAFHNGPSFADYQELRNHILARESDFARGFTEHLIEYALGRPFSIIDDALAEDMTNKAALKNYSVREFIHALVQSETFRKK